MNSFSVRFCNGRMSLESQHQNGIISKGCIEFGWMQVNPCMCFIKHQRCKTQCAYLLPGSAKGLQCKTLCAYLLPGNAKGFDFVDLLVFHEKILFH